jgi:hypothetical protein
MSDKIHMRFYDTSFLDFDEAYIGYRHALMSLTRFSNANDIVRGQLFFEKYAAAEGHKHQALCRECLEYLKAKTGQPS